MYVIAMDAAMNTPANIHLIANVDVGDGSVVIATSPIATNPASIATNVKVRVTENLAHTILPLTSGNLFRKFRVPHAYLMLLNHSHSPGIAATIQAISVGCIVGGNISLNSSHSVL